MGLLFLPFYIRGNNVCVALGQVWAKLTVCALSRARQSQLTSSTTVYLSTNDCPPDSLWHGLEYGISDKETYDKSPITAAYGTLDEGGHAHFRI